MSPLPSVNIFAVNESPWCVFRCSFMYFGILQFFSIEDTIRWK